MKKVLIVGPGISMGGVERASTNIANELSMLGYIVTYHALFPHKEFFTLRSAIKYEKPQDQFNKKRLNILSTIQRIRRSVKSDQPDVIIAFSKFYAALTAVALIGIKVRFIISERSSPLYNWGKRISIFNKIAFSLRSPDAVFAQTNAAAQVQRKYYGSKTTIEVIPNIVKQVELHPSIEREEFILAVGRMNDHLKGFDRLIQTMALIKSNWILQIAGGDEEEAADLKQLASDLGISLKVRFLGRIHDIDNLYARAGIFVIPSRSEGFPNALVEAMAAGIPCISFDFVAGPNEIITHEYDGILVNDGDLIGLANEIDRLAENNSKRLRLSHNALSARERFGAGKIVSRICSLIENEN